MSNSELPLQFGNDRISSRQINEAIGIARGLCADGVLNQAEVEFLQKWLAANMGVSDQPVINLLYRRVSEILKDGVADSEERVELLETLNNLGGREFELGELLKSSTLPLCQPQPPLWFSGKSYCFTGTFMFGTRKACEEAVIQRGACVGNLKKSTDFLIIGSYATESWKHSSFGNKILKAAEMRDQGHSISIISEEHWKKV